MGHASYIGRVGALAVALGIGSAVTGGYGMARADDDTASGSQGQATTNSDASGAAAGPRRNVRQDRTASKRATERAKIESRRPVPRLLPPRLTLRTEPTVGTPEKPGVELTPDPTKTTGPGRSAAWLKPAQLLTDSLLSDAVGQRVWLSSPEGATRPTTTRPDRPAVQAAGPLPEFVSTTTPTNPSRGQARGNIGDTARITAEVQALVAGLAAVPQMARTEPLNAASGTVEPGATITPIGEPSTPPAQPIRDVLWSILGSFGYRPDVTSPGDPDVPNPLGELIWGFYRRLEPVVGNDSPTQTSVGEASITHVSSDGNTVEGALKPDFADASALASTTAAGATTPTQFAQPETASADAAQIEAEREESDAEFNMSLGWIPGVGTVYNGVNLVTDLREFSTAVLNGDTADMLDEIGDMTIDLIGMVPIVGGPLAASIHWAIVPPPGSTNHSPSPVSDSFTVDEDAQLINNVLTNDTDVDGDTLTAVLVAGPANGTVVVNANGTFTYTPAANFNGTDSFTYRASDGTTSSAPVTVTITITPVNDPPVAGDDSVSTAEGTQIVIDVLANDIDVDGTLTVTGVSAANHGQVVFDSNTVTYTPDANYHGPDTFSYIVSDGTITDTAVVTVTVTPVNSDNQAPIIGDDAFSFTIDETTGVLTGTLDVTDPDGDDLTYAIGTAPSSALAQVVVDSSTGSWVFTPSAAALVAAYSSASPLTTEFTIIVSDGQATTPVTVSVPVEVTTDALVSILNRDGSKPSGVAVGADGTVYVINSGANTLSVLSPDGTIISTVHVGASPTAVRVGTDGRVWVTNGADGTVTVLDRTGTTIDTTIDVGASPIGLAFGADGSVYVADAGDGTISVINAATNTLDRTITVGGTPTGVAAGPDGRIYVADFSGNVVTVVDTAAGDTLTTIDDVSANPFGIAVNPGGTIYLTHPVDGIVSVLTPNDDGYTSQSISVGSTPTAISVGASGLIYVTNTDADTVTVIAPDTLTATTIATGISPNAIAIGPDGSLYITNGGSDDLDIIDVQTSSATTIPVGVDPNTVTVDAQGNLTVTNNYDNSASVITHPAVTVTSGNVTTGTVTVGTATTGTVTDTGYAFATGADPSKLVVSPDSRYAYIASASDGTVSIIDSASGSIVTIPTGSNAGDYGDVVVSPDSRYAYVINYGSGGSTVSIINPANGTATTIPVGYSVFKVVVSPDSRYAYVTGSGIGGATVTIIDPVAGTATSTGPISSDAPLVNPVVVSPDGRYAYARTRDGVSIIDPATGTATTIRTGTYVFSPGAPVVVSPDGRYAYVTNQNDGTVSVINPVTGVATTITTGTKPGQVVVSPDGRYAYVTADNYSSGGRVTIINPAGATVTIQTDYRPGGDVVVSPDGRYAYARADDGVMIINPASGTATTVHTGSFYPYELVVSPDSRYAYAVNDNDGTVSIINPATGTATTVATGNGPSGVVVSPDSHYAYVVNANGVSDDTVSIINPDTGISVNVSIPDSRNLLNSRLAVSPDSRYAYIAYNAVSVINPITGTVTTIPATYYTNAPIPVSPDSRYAYVASGNGTVTVIDSTKIEFPQGTLAPHRTVDTYMDTPVTFDPTANPFMPPTGVTVTGVGTPAHGTAVVIGSRITYTPTPGYTGTDTFTYTAGDGDSTDTGTVTVHINSVYQSVSYEAGPTGTQDLYRTLRDAMDGVDGKSLDHGIYTQHVLVDGQQSLIVYIAGTNGFIHDQSVFRNLPSAAGVVDPAQIDVIKNAMTDPNESILLVGYSQGGMDAQNIAAHAAEYGLQDQIKAVVTFGSPLVQTDRYPTVHLEDYADPIPKINLLTPTNWIAGLVNSVVNKNVYLASSTNDFDTAVLSNVLTVGVHGVRSTYEDVGLHFDVDTSPHWDGLRDAMAPFVNGQVVPEGYVVIDGTITKLPSIDASAV